MMALGIAACLLLGTLAIVGAEIGRPGLVRIGKPLATAALWLIVGLPPWSHFQTLVAVGILFSLAGDIALLGDGDREFLIGTGAFLAAHVCYIFAFAGATSASQAGAGAYLWPPTFVAVAASIALVALLWRKAGKMRVAIVIYAAAITTMLVTAFASARVSAPASTLAAVATVAGVILFYASDSSLAWNRFRGRLPRSALITLSTYWLGQIGIALAARWHG
jgi:uncharacterized membrane protein YhhN